MTLEERLPGLSDAELKTLAANAQRLRDSGDKKQKDAAEALWPSIEAEVQTRRAAQPAKAAKPRKKTARAPA